MQLRNQLKLVAVCAAAIVSLTACGSSQESLTLTQSSDVPVELIALDLNAEGDQGDVTTFDADIYKDGELYGAMMGTMTKVGSLGEGSRPDREERMLVAVYDLPGGQINVQGVSYYLDQDQVLPENEAITRAIVGGTGDYLGISGEVTTTRNADDSYTHVLSFFRP